MSVQRLMSSIILVTVTMIAVMVVSGCGDGGRRRKPRGTGPGCGTRRPTRHSGWSFVSEPYVHPLIVRKLLGELCDHPGVISAIDLSQAEASDRFDGPISTTELDGRIWVTAETPNGVQFSYIHVGQPSPGTHVVVTQEGGSGSGVFADLLVLAVQDMLIYCWEKSGFTPTLSPTLQLRGHMPLGDRFDGEVEIDETGLKIRDTP